LEAIGFWKVLSCLDCGVLENIVLYLKKCANIHLLMSWGG
jgi:hypothetical protein